jgi:uncharacterized protein YndB with AHSA1/START domain
VNDATKHPIGDQATVNVSVAVRPEQAFEIGRILVWEPPHRLLFEWRASNFTAAEHTEVEVRFRASASGPVLR